MLERFFEAKSFRFHVPKVIQVPKLYFLNILVGKSCMYAVYVLCMYYMYVFVCIKCMYCMYVLYVLYVCKAPWPSRPPGAKSPWKRNLRIQGRMQIFEKMSQMALNHDLRPELESRGKMLQIRLKIMDLQNNWFCGKFKHCKFRISVPMSYITK